MQNATVLAPDPSFILYRVFSELYHVNYVGVKLQDDFEINKVDFLMAIEQYQPAVIFISYPNNPTANLFDEDTILEILKNAPGIVVIDEAYYFFSNKTLIGLLSEFDNLVIIRSLSKVGFAGIRFGYLFAHKNLAKRINLARPLFNMNSLTKYCADYAFAHYDQIIDLADLIAIERQRVFYGLKEIPKITVKQSKTNFIIFKSIDSHNNAWIKEQLFHDKIVVATSNLHSINDSYLRITVGEKNNNHYFLEKLKNIMS